MADKMAVPRNVLVAKVAQLAATGMGQQKMSVTLSEEMGEPISWRQIKKILDTQECKDIVKEVTDVAVSQGKALAKSEMARLVNKAVKVVEFHLDENNLQAVPILFKAIGVDQQEQQQQGNQSLTVVLPGTAEKPAHEIKFESTGVKNILGEEET